MANPWDPALYAALREFKATNRDLRARYGAHAWGIGRKEVNGRRTDELVLRFYVERKQPEAALGSMLVPKQIEFTSPATGRVFTLGTDVIVRPKGKLDADPETKIRPIPGGVSFGTTAHTGTLGGWCWDTTDHTLVALSNSHVLGPDVGKLVRQPGLVDGGLPEDKIGTTKRVIPLLTAPAINTVDCAIAGIDLPSDVLKEVLEIGPALFFTAPAVLDLAVEKFGQTTEHTFGVIVDVDFSGAFEGDLEFDDCIFIDSVAPSTQWANSGDSGSLVFSQTPVSGTSKPAVGLHFAHPKDMPVSGIACKIQSVFDQLQLTTICNGQITALAERMLADPASPPRPFGELPRAIQSQLAASRSGKLLTDALDLHRVEVVQLVQDPAIQRSLIDAFSPIIAGATNADELLARTVTSADIARLGAAAKLLASRASNPLASVIDQLSKLTARAEGRSLREIFGTG